DNVNPTIEVTKTALPTNVNEPSGSVTLTVKVKNTSVSSDPVTLTSLNDSVYGDLNGTGTCATGGSPIASGATYTCSFTKTVSGKAGPTPTKTVTAHAKDDENNDTSNTGSATVTVDDVAPTIDVTKTAGNAADGATSHIDEPGATVTYTVTIKNTSGSSDPVTVSSFKDAVGGPGSQPAALACTDATTAPFNLFTTAIASGATVTCTFTRSVTGNATDTSTDTVTVVAGDDDTGGTDATDSDSATVAIDNVNPTIEVTKTALPTNVNDPSGSVTFTVKVKNTSVSSDPVTLTSLNDSVYG